MIIGVRAHDYGRHEAEELAQLIAAEGFKAVHLAPAKCLPGLKSLDDIREEHIRSLHESMEKAGVEVSILGCYVDLSSDSEAIREKAVRQVIQTMRWNKDIMQARAVGSESCYGRPGKLEKRRLFPFLLRSVDEILSAAEDMDTDFALEPAAWHTLEDAETARALLDRCKSRHLKIIFDQCSFLPYPSLVNQTEYWPWCLDLLEDYIVTVHLRDVLLGDQNIHVQVPLGKGQCDFSYLKKWLKKRPDMPVIREGLEPANASWELAMMKDFDK